MTTRAFDHDQDELLFGATDEESAVLVDDYPYGRRVRTQIRYWIETTKHGDRFCSQTLNPKSGRWNKPKRSTYSNVMVMYREAESGHISRIGLGDWPGAERIAKFCALVGAERLSEAQKAKLAEVIGYERGFKDVKWEVRESSSMTAEENAERDAKQKQAMGVIGRRVAIETHKAGKALAGEEV